MEKERRNKTDAGDVRENGNGASLKHAGLPLEARDRKRKF